MPSSAAGLPIGTRVRVEAEKQIGSAYLLRGLTGEVIGPHPIASDWVKVRLDPNPITPHEEWSMPLERLVILDGFTPESTEMLVKSKTNGDEWTGAEDYGHPCGATEIPPAAA